ncbi:GNAT family protein [Glutamicibacter endophyticus]
MEPLIQPVIPAGDYTLRPFAAKDAPAVRDASGDPLVPLITTVPAHGTESEILQFIDRQIHRAVTGTGYSFAIAETASDRAVGQIGLWLKDLDQGRASIGYWVAPSDRQRGVASAALEAISRWGLDLPSIYRLQLYVEPWNEGSWRAAERCGYLREGLLHSWQDVGGHRKDMYMYACLR